MRLYNKLVSTSAVQALGMALLFMLHVLMTRIIGAEAYGTYVYIFSWVNVAVMIGKFGADRGVVRLISRSISYGDFNSVSANLKWSIKLVSGFTFIAGVLATLIFTWVEGIGHETVHLTGAVGLAVLIAVSFSFLQKGALLGIGAAATSKIPTEVLRPLFMIGGILALAEVVPELGAEDMMWLTLFAYISAIALGHVLWRRSYRRARLDNSEIGRDQERRPKLHDFAHFAIVSVSQTVMRHTDVILIGVIAGPEEVAYYAVAARIVSLIAFFQRATAPVLQPIISRAYTRGEHDVLRATVAKTTLVTIVATLTLAVVLLEFGREALSIFGPGFEQGTLLLQVLLMGQLVKLLSGPNAVLLSMTDNQNVAARALWIAAGVNIVGNLALISQFGALGAAIATAVSIAISNFLLIWACWLKLRIDPSVLGVLQFLRKQIQEWRQT